eukprot:3494777-Pyramimonas_sp.AAC.1
MLRNPFRADGGWPQAVGAALETPSEVCPSAASPEATPHNCSSQLSDSGQALRWSEDVPPVSPGALPAGAVLSGLPGDQCPALASPTDFRA